MPGSQRHNHHQHNWLTAREMQAVIRTEARNSSRGTVDCCPSVEEMVEPLGGKNLRGMYVELFRDGNLKQSFFEWSCHKDVENKPCRFVDKKLMNQSRCVQKYSFTYALIKDDKWESRGYLANHRHQRHTHHQIPNEGWSLDYIQVRSGCACEFRPMKSEKKNRHSSSNRHERRKHSTDVAAFESPPDT